MDSFFINFSGLYSLNNASILDTKRNDASYRGEDLPRPQPSPSVLDLSGLEGTSCYCDPEAEEAIKGAIADVPLRALHFIDSGDYHYVSKLFTDRICVPFTLVLFDNHPDMQAPAFGDILSCGGWVRKALEENHLLERVIIIGSDPSLAEEVEDFCGNDALEGRTCVGADSCPARSKLILLSADVEPSVLAGLVEGCNIYISIDKDVMTREYARTDWSQGVMTLPSLLDFLFALMDAGGAGPCTRQAGVPLGAVKERSARVNILGVDICGGLSEAKGGRSEDFHINATADCAIASAFIRL